MTDFKDGWDLDLSYANRTLTIRRKRPDLGPDLVEERVFPFDVLIPMLAAAKGQQADAPREAAA